MCRWAWARGSLITSGLFLHHAQVSPGNHERDDPSVSSYHPSQSFYHGNDGGGECGVPYSALFPMPAPADDPRTDTPWYAFTIGPVRFVVASTEHGASS